MIKKNLLKIPMIINSLIRIESSTTNKRVHYEHFNIRMNSSSFLLIILVLLSLQLFLLLPFLVRFHFIFIFFSNTFDLLCEILLRPETRFPPISLTNCFAFYFFSIIFFSNCILFFQFVWAFFRHFFG